MPTPTYTPLANITLGSTATSVTFSSISGAYRDLVLVIGNLNGASSTINPLMRFNSDSGSNYSMVSMSGNGSSTASYTTTNTAIYVGLDVSFSTTANGNVVTHIMDYSATDKHKTVLSRTDNPTTKTEATASRWASTSAITSVSLTVTSFAAGSTFALYGIAA